MKFYIVNETCNAKEIGPEFPQIQEVNKIDSDWIIELATNFATSFHRNIGEGSATIRKRAKLTDFLSASFISGTGFIVKENLVESLQQFSNNSLQIFSLPLVQNTNLIDNYIYCHFTALKSNCINFNLSKFRCFGEDDMISFNNVDEMNLFVNSNPSFTAFYPENVNFNYIPGLELFKVHPNLKFTYCSDHFRQWYQSNNLTGLEFVGV